jgi:hypothetical protein
LISVGSIFLEFLLLVTKVSPLYKSVGNAITYQIINFFFSLLFSLMFLLSSHTLHSPFREILSYNGSPAHSGSRPLIQFCIHIFTAGRTPWTGDQPVGSPLCKHRQHKHRINAYTHQTSTPWVGFELTSAALERAKTVHALDCAATVTGIVRTNTQNYVFGCFLYGPETDL